MNEIGLGGMDRIHLAGDIDQCRAVVNTVRNFGYYRILEYCRETERLAASK
jgi:hypothetical protein